MLFLLKSDKKIKAIPTEKMAVIKAKMISIRIALLLFEGSPKPFSIQEKARREQSSLYLIL